VSTLESENVEFKYEECDVIEFSKQLLLSLNFADSSENHFRFVRLWSVTWLRWKYSTCNKLSQSAFKADKFTKQGTITLEGQRE
jgi:hypothetical protein